MIVNSNTHILWLVKKRINIRLRLNINVWRMTLERDFTISSVGLVFLLY